MIVDFDDYDDEMMSNKDYQRKMMQSVADGVEEYFQTN